MLEPSAFTESVRSDCATINALTRAAADQSGSDRLGSPVDYCGDWVAGDVVRHLGEIHRFVTGVVTTGQPSEQTVDRASDAELASWFDDGTQALIAALDACNPDDECWTFGFRPGRAWFWPRRMAIENTIHRFDVEHALATTQPIPRPIAIAGLEEITDVFFDRQVSLDRTPPLPAPVAFAPTDVGGNGEDDSQAAFIVGDGNDPAATISGTASDLLLSVWGRPHGELIRDGDAEALAAYDAALVTP